MASFRGLGICLTTISALIFIIKTRKALRLPIILPKGNRHLQRKPTPLERLPPEVLLDIIDLLPAFAAASLTLSSIPLMLKLGTKQLTSMSANRLAQIQEHWRWKYLDDLTPDEEQPPSRCTDTTCFNGKNKNLHRVSGEI
ncbi:hypothetical protein N431DRAFT_444410 [Stipitochalara longipes BDJ]|nr:hypothetical protein N431DRAFT_444410 [Stipitochalara longipes BDJ]